MPIQTLAGGANVPVTDGALRAPRSAVGADSGPLTGARVVSPGVAKLRAILERAQARKRQQDIAELVAWLRASLEVT
jgi:hypothetical protein